MIQREIKLSTNDNTLFVTEQCTNNCIFCCQPPKMVNDMKELYEENLKRIYNAPKDLPLIGITGGEPTLLGDHLIILIKEIRKVLPNTDIQLLSNGRRFSDPVYAKKIADAGGDKLFVGIPLHSDYGKDHDMIAGKKGAYKETIMGLYNLALNRVYIELRVVICKQNYQRLLNIAEFIHRNLPFVGWIAYMGMEHIGYALENEHNVWIEPLDYVNNLCKSIKYLSEWNYDAKIYNIPLCLLPEDVHNNACKSISDWKNEFIEECKCCIIKDKCCGFFATSQKTFKGIKAFNTYKK